MDWHSVLFKSKELGIAALFIRTTILYFALFLSARFMGYRQPGIVTSYNFIMAAGVSHIAAARMVNPESRPIDAIAIIAIYTVLNMLLSFIHLKYPPLLSQKPILLVKDGKVKKENLSKANLNIHNVLSSLRLKNTFSVKNVSYAFLEPVGEVSVAINPTHMPPTKALVGISQTSQTLPEIIIYKGKVNEHILRKNSLDSNWLKTELLKNNITDPKNVYLGILESDMTLYISD